MYYPKIYLTVGAISNLHQVVGILQRPDTGVWRERIMERAMAVYLEHLKTTTTAEEITHIRKPWTIRTPNDSKHHDIKTEGL